MSHHSKHHFITQYISLRGTSVNEFYRMIRMRVASHVKLQLHDAIYRLRSYSNSLIHILSLSNPHNNVASIQKNRGDKSYRVIVALEVTEQRPMNNEYVNIMN